MYDKKRSDNCDDLLIGEWCYIRPTWDFFYHGETIPLPLKIRHNDKTPMHTLESKWWWRKGDLLTFIGIMHLIPVLSFDRRLNSPMCYHIKVVFAQVWFSTTYTNIVENGFPEWMSNVRLDGASRHISPHLTFGAWNPELIQSKCWATLFRHLHQQTRISEALRNLIWF